MNTFLSNLTDCVLVSKFGSLPSITLADTVPFLFLGLVLIAILCVLLISIANYVQREKILNDICDQEFISCEDFENRWIITNKRTKNAVPCGFKYEDRPGCYIITIYDKPVENNCFENFQNVYVGQSVKMCQRVHNHFNGKGNGDVYADIKYGKFVYVRFVPCEISDLNKMEKHLISVFSANTSYNRTRGGL